MSVSKELKRSAKDFSTKYSCKFDFVTFESRAEGYTFLSPNNGWREVYKQTFDKMYKQALEAVAIGKKESLNGEAMLDDFEYTLMRPYANETELAIKHRSYVGMDRVTRLEYLDELTKAAPSNPVALCTEKYKSGEISLKQMLRETKSLSDFQNSERENYVGVASYIQALKNTNEDRSFLWRTFHPFKNGAEKRSSVAMEKTLIEKTGTEESYGAITGAAYDTFDGYKRVRESLDVNMMHAKEESQRKEKMKDAIRESLHVDLAGNEKGVKLSNPVDKHNAPTAERQIIS